MMKPRDVGQDSHGIPKVSSCWFFSLELVGRVLNNFGLLNLFILDIPLLEIPVLLAREKLSGLKVSLSHQCFLVFTISDRLHGCELSLEYNEHILCAIITALSDDDLVSDHILMVHTDKHLPEISLLHFLELGHRVEELQHLVPLSSLYLCQTFVIVITSQDSHLAFRCASDTSSSKAFFIDQGQFTERHSFLKMSHSIPADLNLSETQFRHDLLARHYLLLNGLHSQFNFLETRVHFYRNTGKCLRRCRLFFFI